jgi:hypothetical protein
MCQIRSPSCCAHSLWEELGESFWNRMRGNIDLGTSFSQSNNRKMFLFKEDLDTNQGITSSL